MRFQYIILGTALLAVLLFFISTATAQNNSYNSNITAAINSTSLYIGKVNQSGYLIFYPDLSEAYNDLNLAKNESKINSSYSYSLLAKASESAGQQENMIYQYKTISLYVLAILSVFLLILIYMLMKPHNQVKNQTKKRK